MDISKELNEIIENAKNLSIEVESDSKMAVLNKDFSNVTEKTIDSASKYIIKAMPVPDAVKDILLDIKDALKTKDIKKIVGTVIKSSVREGMEIIGVSSRDINSIMELKNTAIKGGFITSLKDGIEIVAKNFLKNNIVGEYVYDFFEKLKGYIMNKEFSKSLNRIINRLQEKKENFLNKCEEWYNAYKSMNMDKINVLARELNSNKYILSRYSDCVKENKVIQNMTEMVNSKKELLTANQQRLCQVI